MRVRFLFLVVNSFIFVTLFSFPSQTAAQAPLTYYVDCTNGVDSNNGTSASSAWKTLTKANTAPFAPGEKLLFKRGCTFVGTLTADQTGTAVNPVTFGAYGTGDNPLFQADANNAGAVSAVSITGSYQIIEQLSTTVINMRREPTCTDQFGQNTVYGYYIGFSFTDISHHNTVQDSEAFGPLSGGASFMNSASFNKITKSTIHDLTGLWQRPTDPGGLLGAIGINLHGNDGEFSYNEFRNNKASCMLSTGEEYSYSAPFEVFNANRNFVHHNKAYGHKKHFEMGKSTGFTTDDNRVAYNLFVSDMPSAKGPNIHGNDNFGPVNRTKIYNNTIVFTGANSEGIVASGPDTIVKNNIFIADGRTSDNTPTGTNLFKVAYSCATSTIFSNNIYWRIGGGAKVQLWRSPTDCPTTNTLTDTTSRVQDPLFADTTTSNYTLQATSFGLNHGNNEILTLAINGTVLSTDLNDGTIPQDTTVDIGAYEYGTVPVLLGDIIYNCQVDLTDLSSLLGAFGTTNPTREVNGIAPVNLTDLSLLLSNFGKRCS